jgi:hypothetical protein
MANHDVPQDELTNSMVIPYFPGDQGRPGIERPLKTPPLKTPVISYLCPSIAVLVGRVPGPAVFTPGEDLEVKVSVANYGGGTMNAIANVAVFWSVPTTGFTNPTPLGQQPVIVSTHGGVETTPVIKGHIPAGAPNHICLLARVTAPGDSLQNTTIDPVNDRH